MKTNFLTVKEAAERLRVSTKQIDRLVISGELAVFQPRPGCKRLVSADEVEDYVTRNIHRQPNPDGRAAR